MMPGFSGRISQQSHHLPRLGHPRSVPASLGLALLLALTGGWLVPQVIEPAPVQAYTNRVNVSLDVQPDESYDALVRRAEAVARAAAQRSFDRDLLVTAVSVMIIAQKNATTVVPLLTLEVGRQEWKSLPEPRRWATYYPSAKSLLGLTTPPATATTPTASPTVTTPVVAPGAAPGGAPAPSNQPGQPGQPGSSRPLSTGTGSPAPEEITPPQTPRPILPDRINTPAGIGK